MQEQLTSSGETRETWPSEGLKNQETGHFEHLRDTASSYPGMGERCNYPKGTSAAAIRPVTVWGWWIPTGSMGGGMQA
jgi:hypothetical protein